MSPEHSPCFLRAGVLVCYPALLVLDNNMHFYHNYCDQQCYP